MNQIIKQKILDDTDDDDDGYGLLYTNNEINMVHYINTEIAGVYYKYITSKLLGRGTYFNCKKDCNYIINYSFNNYEKQNDYDGSLYKLKNKLNKFVLINMKYNLLEILSI